MEWREQSSFTCEDAFNEARRWMEEVTQKSFGSKNFRVALENGVLLCDLMNKLKPGLINRVNRLSTPIAGLDNVSVFLKACRKLGLNESQLFHPGDLQDLSTRVTLRKEEGKRRLKNVLITIYWLGRKAQLDPFYNGPHLNFKAFEGLLGLALSKALEEGSGMCAGEYSEAWYPDKEELSQIDPYRREDSVDSTAYVDFKVAQPGNEGCESDAEAEQGFRMACQPRSLQPHRGYVPPPLLRRKQGRKEHGSGSASPLTRECQRPEIRPQVNPGWIWSKSLTHIPMVYSVSKSLDGKTPIDAGPAVDTAGKWKPDHPPKAKDSEVKWQDDLTKWKSRRRSTHTDLHRRTQDRERVVNQMTNRAEAGSRESGAGGGLPKRDQPLPSRSNPALSSFYKYTSHPPHAGLRPRAHLARSYATEAPLSPTASDSLRSKAQNQPLPIGSLLASDPDFQGEEVHCACLASEGADIVTSSADLPFSSQTQASPAVVPATTGSVHADLTSPQPVPLAGDPTAAVTSQPASCTASGSSQRAHSRRSPDRKAHSVESHLVGQHRPLEQTGQQGTDHQPTGLYRCSSRTMSWSGSASLPRGYRRSEGSSRLSVVVMPRPFGAKPARVSSLPGLSDDDNQLLKRENYKSVQPTRPILHRQVATSQIRAPYQATSGNQEEKVLHSDMRVSLSLKPNSRPDFGFQTHWDSTGARVKVVKRGSPAELCQLRVGDDIVAVNGIPVAHMSSDQWKNTMASALQTGSLSMDLRRYGSDDWGTSGIRSTQQCQSRKTLNLTSAAPMLMGQSEQQVPLSNSNAATQCTVTHSARLNDGTGTEAVEEFANNNGCASRKECERIVMKNKKRRAEFFKSEGGSESAISDIQVPSLHSSSCNWSWDHEEERRRQEKWQEEQERLLQEQYRRDQDRLEAEWQLAQQDTVGDESESARVMASVAVNAQPSVNGVTFDTTDKREAEQSPAYIAVTSQSQRTEEEERNDKLTEPDWMKSTSSPVLTDVPKQPKGDLRKRKGRSLSRAEQERQQILEEMKKRNQLLNDNSWIRQRSLSISYKEPVNAGPLLKRHESLDNMLTSWPQYPGSSTTTMPSSSRPQSVVTGYSAPGRNPSTRCSVGATHPLKQAAWSANPPVTSHSYSAGGSLQYARLLGGTRTCCVCERVLGRGAAMVIEALGLCFHLACFQCVNCCRHLGGAGTGVQVRMRNRKPFCEFCYFNLKHPAIPSM